MLKQLTVFVLVAATTAGATGFEEKYIATRDAHIARINALKVGRDEADRAALKELEALLGEMLGKKGTINLETLQHEQGFGRADGLNVDGASGYFVTTVELFESFRRSNPRCAKLPKELEAVAGRPEIYGLIVTRDARNLHYVEVPVAPDKRVAVARAFLASDSQDPAVMAPPTYLTLFARIGERIYVQRRASGINI